MECSLTFCSCKVGKWEPDLTQYGRSAREPNIYARPYYFEALPEQFERHFSSQHKQNATKAGHVVPQTRFGEAQEYCNTVRYSLALAMSIQQTTWASTKHYLSHRINPTTFSNFLSQSGNFIPGTSTSRQKNWSLLLPQSHISLPCTCSTLAHAISIRNETMASQTPGPTRYRHATCTAAGLEADTWYKRSRYVTHSFI